MDDDLNNVLATHNATVAKAFGMRGKNITEILPTNIDNTDISDDDSGHYATVLAVISGVGTLTTVIGNFKDDLASGELGKDSVMKLQNASFNIKNSGKNISSRLNDDVLNGFKQNLANNNTVGRLNDTGIIWGGNETNNENEGCTGMRISAQDCSHGRDAGLTLGYSTFTYVAGVGSTKTSKIGGGSAGFDFTKLGMNGTELTIQTATWASDGSGSEELGTKWSCVRDNITGFIWEVKTDAGSADDYNDNNDYRIRTYTNANIHHQDNAYRWGGITAIGKNHSNKEGSYHDDWNGLVNGTNDETLCGFNDWKVPTINQLASISHKGRSSTATAIDEDYFPNTIDQSFWSASPYVSNSGKAWQLSFYDAGDPSEYRDQSFRVRLVRP